MITAQRHSRRYFSNRLRYAISALLLLSLPVLAVEGRSFRGNAFDLRTGQFLYSENHTETYRNGQHAATTLLYKDPAEKVFAEKRSEYRPGSTVPSFRLEDRRSGYVEGCSPSGGAIMLFHRDDAQSAQKSGSIPAGSDLVVDSGFHLYLKKNRDALLAGQTLVFRFGVPSRLTTFDFRVRKIADTEVNGRRAVRFQLAPDNLILRSVVAPILVDYDPTTMDLLAYTGLSNIYDENGKAYNVYIVFRY
ncbi:hypothetical protein [Leptonema illini]|uniref:Uncharacterized protein n=1 Tax=Leptonema illini DSM 21528 TaxID=929563 RepID=H2CFT1_9LEPT|nr:hypothetical protein [Leptonema illini]EHQ06780.1 hypothetical protein Lepil_2102 [Leptonema illini DSM 21528]